MTLKFSNTKHRNYHMLVGRTRSVGSKNNNKKKRLISLPSELEDSNKNCPISVDTDRPLDIDVSFSSAVVMSEDEVYHTTSDLLMIAPTPSPSDSGVYDHKFVIPPLRSSLGKKKKLLLNCRSSSELSDGDEESREEMYFGGEKSNKLNEEETWTFFGYTRRQWAILVIFGIANVLATMAISIQSPFYPQEAEEKGATATEYGFVFGVYQLVMFLASPIFGLLIGKQVPAKLMFTLGVFVTGVCAILFGFLDYIQDRVLFITFSFIVRIVQSCGDAAYVTASFTILAMEFPDSVATTFAALETCSGIGLIIGPTIGGALFEVGGFLLPFLTIGAILVLSAVLTVMILPSAESSESAGGGGKGFVALIKVPVIAMATLGVIVGSLGIGFLSGTLEPHVRAEFNLTPLFTGLVFIIEGGTYALSAPFWGMICDKFGQPKLVMLAGCLLCIVGFLLVGPAPFMPFDPTLWSTCIGLGIYGLGDGATLVSGFILMLQYALARGFPDNVSTYGLVSGLWTSAFAFGSFVGPSTGGVLLDNFDFPHATLFVLAITTLVFFIVLGFYSAARSKSPSDSTPHHFKEALSLVSVESQNGPISKSYGTLSLSS